ncbi:MAG: hypothetical protein ABL999_04920 [Pyrinomonadaceae bacterium]
MTAKLQREIVIEFEKIQLIRKRAKTTLLHCSGCGALADLVLLSEAVTLFDTRSEDLLHFAAENGCHYHVLEDGETYLCVGSLLESMQQKNNSRRLLAKETN